MQKSTAKQSNLQINWFGLSLGVIGLLAVVWGTLLPPILTQKLLFLSGTSLLLLSSIIEKHKFFVVLQIVAVVSTLMALTSFTQNMKASIPIMLSIISIFYLFKNGLLKNKVNWIGLVGLVFLALGYAVSNPIVYFLGGVSLAIYSYLSYKQGSKLALIFLILNIIFSISSSIGIYRMFFA